MTPEISIPENPVDIVSLEASLTLLVVTEPSTAPVPLLQSITFSSRWGSPAYRVSELLKYNPELLIDCIGQRERFDQTHLRMGLDVVVDGLLWTAGILDDFGYAANWFDAGRRLLAAAEGTVVSASVWDQSWLCLAAERDRVVLWDRHYVEGRCGAKPAFSPWMPVSVSRRQLFEALAREARLLCDLREDLLRGLERRNVDVDAGRRRAQEIAQTGGRAVAERDFEMAAGILARELFLSGLEEDALLLEEALAAEKNAGG